MRNAACVVDGKSCPAGSRCKIPSAELKRLQRLEVVFHTVSRNHHLQRSLGARKGAKEHVEQQVELAKAEWAYA